MRKKRIFKKMLAVLCSATLLVGGFSGYATHSNAAETSDVPTELKDYTRITMEDFGLTASTDEAGTTYAEAAEGAYTGESLNKTYLDVDVNFNGCADGTKYFQYLYEWDWTQFMRATHWGSGMSVYEGANSTNSLWITAAPNNEFFNLKLAVDMTVNASDDTKTDIAMQVWVNNELQGTLSFTATTDVHKKIYTSAGITYRTPVVAEPVDPNLPEELQDYTRITMAKFGLTASTDELGTAYAEAAEGAYTGESLHKTYLDVDVHFNGCADGTKYFQYLYEWDWTQFMRATHWGSGMSVYEGANSTNSLWITAAPNDEFFNLKLAVDMTANASDNTKTDIQMQVWVNNELQGILSFTASTEVYKNIYTSAGITYRTPVIKEAAEPEEPVVIGDPIYPNVPSELSAYTKIDAASLGIVNEDVHNGAGIWKEYTPSNVTTFNKAYMDVDVSFEGSEDLNDAIRYLGGETYMLYIAWEALNLYDFSSGKFLYIAPLADYGVKEGDYVNLKVATDINTNGTDAGKSDVTFKIWINNQVVQPLEEVSATDSVTSTISTDKLANKIIVATSATPKATIKIAKSVENMVVHYSDISQFRAETGHSAPEADGYLFAGWYTDEACTVENAVTTDVMSGAAYAKFVDARVLTVKAQITADTQSTDSSTWIRFVTSVNDKAYNRVGFSISYTKADGTPKEKEYVDDVVYKQLTAMVDDEAKNYTPQGLVCSGATFFKAQILKGITNADFDTPIDVTPFWETLDGTVVSGETVTKKVSDGIQ